MCLEAEGGRASAEGRLEAVEGAARETQGCAGELALQRQRRWEARMDADVGRWAAGPFVWP